MKSRLLWIILGMALAVRLSLLATAWNHPAQMMTNDSEGYWQLAQTMRQQHVFATDGYRPGSAKIFPGNGCYDWSKPGPETFRTPGYPAFLMPWLSPPQVITDPASGSVIIMCDKFHHVLRPAIALQVLLDVLLVFLTFHLGKTLVSHRVGLIAAAFQALSPVVIASCCRILSDSLYALLLTLAIVLLVRHFRKGRWEGTSTSQSRQEAAGESIVMDNAHNGQGRFEWWSLALTAVVMVAACYVRPVGLVMMTLVIFILIFSRMKFRRLALFVGIMVLGISPWIIRNAVVADYKGFSNFATDSMYMYSVPKTQQYVLDHPNSWTAHQFGQGVQHQPRDIPVYTRQEREDIAFSAMKTYPIAFAIVHLKGDVAFWLPGAPDVLEVAGVTSGNKGTLEVLQTQGLSAAVRNYFGDNTMALLLAIPMVAILFVKYVGVLASLKLARLHMQPEVWLMAMIVVVSALLPGPAAHPRFRVPVEPLLNIAAAVGWTLVAGWIVRRRKVHSQGPRCGI